MLRLVIYAVAAVVYFAIMWLIAIGAKWAVDEFTPWIGIPIIAAIGLITVLIERHDRRKRITVQRPGEW